MQARSLIGPLPYFKTSWIMGFDHAFVRNAVLDGDTLVLHKIVSIEPT
jgi:hypothetical protein